MGHKLISFCIAKEAINKKISYRLRENISNDATDKRLISKIYNSSYNETTTKIKQPYQKMGRRPK